MKLIEFKPYFWCPTCKRRFYNEGVHWHLRERVEFMVNPWGSEATYISPGTPYQYSLF